MANLYLSRDSLVVLTDIQMVSYDNVRTERGAVLVAVPDLSDVEERVRLAKGLWDIAHPKKEEEEN